MPLYKKALFVDLVIQSYAPFCSVDTNFNNFWLNKRNYDIIHLHWPEYLFKWEVPSDLELLLLKRVLNEWHQKGTKIVVTRHNYLPHRPNPERFVPLYNLVYASAHAVVHMGQHSELEYLKRYKELISKKQLQVQIPHPIFTNYSNNVSEYEARRHLNIKKNTVVMLVFGEVRNAAEKNLVLTAFEAINHKDKLLLVPGWKFSEGKEPINRLKWFKIQHSKSYRIFYEYIEEDRVQHYLMAANFVFLPRVDTLNSGLPFLAATFNKPIIGMDKGNIGEVLKEFGMPVIENTQLITIQLGIDKIIDLSKHKNFYQRKDSLEMLNYIGKLHNSLFQRLHI